MRCRALTTWSHDALRGCVFGAGMRLVLWWSDTHQGELLSTFTWLRPGHDVDVMGEKGGACPLYYLATPFIFREYHEEKK